MLILFLVHELSLNDTLTILNSRIGQKVMGALGPIAVGLSVTDPSFMHYKSGIYTSSVCTEDLNHALLLVGYGEEPLGDGKNGTQKYWIARNR